MSDATANPLQTGYDALGPDQGIPTPSGNPFHPGVAFKRLPSGLNAQVVVNYLDPVQGGIQLASRTALTAALNLVGAAIGSAASSGNPSTGLAGDIEVLTSAVEALAPIVSGQATSMAAMASSLAALVAQQQSNGQTQAAILASMLRQEANQIAIATKLDALNAADAAAAAQAHADAVQEHTDIVSTNTALATNHADAVAQLSATQAGNASAASVATNTAQGHTDATTLHQDLQGIAASATSTATSTAAELALDQKAATDGSPVSVSATTATTTTLLASSATGWRIGTLAIDATGLLTGLTGTPRVTLFYAATATATSGTPIGTYDVPVGGAPFEADLDVTIPAGMTVRFTNAVGAVTVSCVARVL